MSLELAELHSLLASVLMCFTYADLLVTPDDYAKLCFRLIRDETLAPLQENSWRSFGGRLLGDGDLCIHARLEERGCKVCARLQRFNFPHELLPWRRLQ